MRKHLVTGALGLAALVLNPFYACGAKKLEFTYAAPEMKAAVEGTWQLTLEERSYIFHIAQGWHLARQQHSSRSMIPSAHACGTRTLVASAGACLDSSVMPVIVTLSGVTTEGTFRVVGPKFWKGELTFELDDHQIAATVMPDGTATVAGGTLIRTAR